VSLAPHRPWPAGLGVGALPLPVEPRLVEEYLELGPPGRGEELLGQSQGCSARAPRACGLGQNDLGREYCHSVRVIIIIVIIIVVVVVDNVVVVVVQSVSPADARDWVGSRGLGQ